MKNIYFNRLQKNREKETKNNKNNSIPLTQYIINGNKLNSFSSINKIGIKRSETRNYLNYSNNMAKSYNQSNIYMQTYQNKNNSRCNNHSLFDSNKQQIINLDNNNNYIRFESNNLKNKKETKKDNVRTNNSVYNSLNNKKDNNNTMRNYSYQKNYFNKNITNINYNINIQNFANNKTTSTNNSINSNNYTTNNKVTKYINYIKNDLIQNRNNFSNLKNNYNFTEINDTNKIKTPTIIKNKRKESIKRNLTENNYLKNKEKENYKANRSSSIIKIQINNSKKDKNDNTKNTKKIIKINDLKDPKYKIYLPIKLNIEDINREKLSRLKRIIEQGSTNFNYYKKEISKNLLENNKSPNKTSYNNKKMKNQYIFKKKKINTIKKEENKEGNTNNQKKENNFLIKSTIKKKNKKSNLILNTKFQNTNYKHQSGIKAYNILIHKEKKRKIETNKEKEKRYQRIKYNEINNNNNDDTISLSYTNDKNVFFPFLIEQFNIYYNKLNQNLIIIDKNKKNIEINNESDDDDYQLTKEIILLKRGLAKKSELSDELRKKIKEMRIQRIYTLNVFGNKNIYKKKVSNYKVTKL